MSCPALDWEEMHPERDNIRGFRRKQTADSPAAGKTASIYSSACSLSVVNVLRIEILQQVMKAIQMVRKAGGEHIPR